MQLDTTILIIEDDKSIQKFLTLSLKISGYSVTAVKSGIDGISLFYTNNPDIILLDLGLPDIDGMEVLGTIREKSDVPVIIISARGQEQEKVSALDLGADDYVTKPFNMQELMARIRVALRKRLPEIKKQPVYSRKGLLVDFERRLVSVDQEEVHLTPMEYKLVQLLIENSGKVLTHGYICRNIWGHENSEDYQSLRVCMANIRRKIEKNTAEPQYILTEVGVGYRLAED